MRRKLKEKLGAIPAGEWVTVTAATNIPRWQEERLVFISHATRAVYPHQCDHALVSLNDGFVNP